MNENNKDNPILAYLVMAALGLAIIATVLSYVLYNMSTTDGTVMLSCNQYTLHALNLSECVAHFEYGGKNITFRGTYDLMVRE